MVETYVPFRNGLMLSSVAALAVSLFPDEEVQIYLGAHADDAAGNAYADCSQEFTDTIGKAINIGTYGKVHLVAPLVNMNKAGVVALGMQLGVPYILTWSCYEGREKACGTCGTCIDRQNAFIANNLLDPILYEQRI
jgi:7-cyano-7-deazaguanine synthase